MALKFLFFLLLVGNGCQAQRLQNTLHFDTLEGVFKESNRAIDGYFFSGIVIDIPEGVASKCNNQHIQLLGKLNTYYLSSAMSDTLGEYEQGRETIYKTYELHTIYVFNAKKKTWTFLYSQQEDN